MYTDDSHATLSIPSYIYTYSLSSLYVHVICSVWCVLLMTLPSLYIYPSVLAVYGSWLYLVYTPPSLTLILLFILFFSVPDTRSNHFCFPFSLLVLDPSNPCLSPVSLSLSLSLSFFLLPSLPLSTPSSRLDLASLLFDFALLWVVLWDVFLCLVLCLCLCQCFNI